MSKTSVKNDRVPYMIPLVPGETDTHEFVAVNGKSYMIEKGVAQMLPRAVAEVLDNKYAQMREASRLSQVAYQDAYGRFEEII